MKLYYSPGSCALASHIALAETGADYEAIRVDFAAAEQTGDAYLHVNPKGRVPALVTASGTLTETPAVLAYLAQTFADAKLAPQDPFEFARAQEFNSYLCSTVHVAHAHKGRGARWASEPSSFEDMKAKVAANMRDCFSIIEQKYMRGPWVMGDNYTICDAYLYTVSRWLEGDGVERADFAKVEAQALEMEQRDPVKRALSEHFG